MFTVSAEKLVNWLARGSSYRLDTKYYCVIVVFLRGNAELSDRCNYCNPTPASSSSSTLGLSGGETLRYSYSLILLHLMLHLHFSSQHQRAIKGIETSPVSNAWVLCTPKCFRWARARRAAWAQDLNCSAAAVFKPRISLTHTAEKWLASCSNNKNNTAPGAEMRWTRNPPKFNTLDSPDSTAHCLVFVGFKRKGETHNVGRCCGRR